MSCMQAMQQAFGAVPWLSSASYINSTAFVSAFNASLQESEGGTPNCIRTADFTPTTGFLGMTVPALANSAFLWQ